MTQSIESMIEVLQAYKDGKKIEYFSLSANKWVIEEPPAWNFDDYQYRIAPEQKKKVKLEAWLACDELRWYLHGAKTDTTWVRVPSEDKEIEL